MSNRMLRAVVATACVGATASCAVHREPALPMARADALGLSPAALDRIAPALQPFVDSGRVSGIYAVIARHGQIGYERTFGWMDVARREPMRRDAIFHIYSMTKPVVAVGILRLVEDGRVGLDDPVSKYIPAFAGVRVFAGGTAAAPVLKDPDSPITVRQLLNHTSGLAYGLTTGPVDTIFTRAKLYDATRTLEQFTDSLARLPLLFSPGTRWSYSSGLDVAGRVIEVASGESLDRFLDEQIFRPLGMRDTGFRVRPDRRARLATVYTPGPDGTLQALGSDGLMAMFRPEARFLWGSGGLLSTPDDYLRFAQMLLNGGTLRATRILRPETVALMTHNTLPPGLTPVTYSALSDNTYGFGLGVAVKVDTARAGRPGPVGIFRWSGYLGTYFWVDPGNDLIAMIWTQLSPGSRVPLERTFQNLVYAALAPPAPRPEDTEVWQPVPPVVASAPGNLGAAPPSDAIVLFDGTSLGEWVNVRDGAPAGWLVRDGLLVVEKSAGNIETRRRFGNYQLHIEWRIPPDITGTGQARGNSGLFVASTGTGDAGYEVQILDSYQNETYVNGMAGSIYKQSVPLANPSRQPGEWQAYDVVWTAPTFAEDGRLQSPARVTVFFNGVLVQKDFELAGETVYIGAPQYRAHGASPIKLQAHGDPSAPISFRNIWVREL